MKYLDLSSKNGPSRHWARFAAAGLLAVAIAGCGGGDGAAGPAGATGPAGSTGPAGPGAVPTVQITALTPAQWADAKFTGVVTGVTIASAPVVKFKVTDATGAPVVGLGNTSKSATAKFASYPNLAFALAKLVPGANGSPSKWVNYAVTTVETPTAAVTATRPSTDNTGTLVDNGDGSYQYTFYRDITKAKDLVAGLTLTGANKAADLGDLTYDPALTHRLVIQLSGNARGTGSNTADGVTVATAVPMKNPINVIYDFIPATGKAVTASDTQREIVAIAKCNECHSKLALHGGGRVDTRFCVVCHNDQRKYGQATATSTNGAFPALTKSVSATGSVSYSPSTYVADGQAIGNFPNYVHKIHMGTELTKKNYNYANVLFNEITYPQPVTNCVKCHDGSATSTTKTLQGDNWKNVPNALACGSCHDGIDFKTGLGTALGLRGQVVGGHVGGAQANDAACASCHGAATIPVYHVTVDPTGANGRGGYPLNTAADTPTVGFGSGQGPSIPLASQLNLPAGVYKLGLEIKSATVAASPAGSPNTRKVTVVYRVLKDGSPVTLATTALASCPAAPGTSIYAKYRTACMINGVDGSPEIYLAYAIPQDGQATDGTATLVDWTNSASVRVSDIVATQGAPAADGWYTVVVNKPIPDNAGLITAGLGIGYNGFVQLNNAAYPKGIRLREPKFAMMPATGNGNTPRRTVVDGDKCNSCHGQLGVAPSFHSGARNNGAGCVFCHTPNTAGGHGAGGWSVASKNLVHSIHASAKREQAFTYEATAENPNGFKEVTYPGVLNNCEQCHVAGSYDFSATANKAALPNLLWTTDSNGDMSKAPLLGRSPWVTTLADYTTNNLVSSPVSSSCFGCHDSTVAVAHMQSNGGTLVSPASGVSTGGRANGFNKVEACMVCHGTGKVADIKAVHMN